MQIYASYHNTGTSHQVEYALTAQGWFWRFLLSPQEWKGPLTKMKGTLDGSGAMWATWEGSDGKGGQYSLNLRLTEVDKNRRWGHASYPPDEGKTKPSVQPSSDNKALPPPGEVPGEKPTLTMSDLLVLDRPREAG